jgi:DNA topoisomerase-3
MDLIDTIQNELLKSPELTGDWERKIRLIEKGEYELEVFKQELFKMVRELTDEVIFNSYRKIEIHDPNAVTVPEKKARAPRTVKEKPLLESLDCPKCKQVKLMKGNAAIGCSNFKLCGFKIPYVVLGKKLSESQLIDLLQKGKTGAMKGLSVPSTAENGSITTRIVNGKLILDANFTVGIE